MSYRITITAGMGETAEGRALTPFEVNRAVERARRVLAESFGGYTEVATSGGWVNDEGRLVEEVGRRWVCLALDMSREVAEWKGRQAAELIAEALQQACVVLEVEELRAAAFVSPAAIPAAAAA